MILKLSRLRTRTTARPRPDHLRNENELREALEKAFDYRGDITITRKDGTKVNGYLFDRRQAQNARKIRSSAFFRPTARA